MGTHTHHIEVNTQNDTAKATKDFKRLKKNQDEVKFESNDGKTVIRYGGTSPFAEANEPKPNTIFDVGNTVKGPFKAANAGEHHFDCGFRNPAAPGGFSPWGRTQGDDTPVDP